MNSQAAAPTAILVDDEAVVLAHLQRILAEKWPELRVLDTAQNGREALSKIRDQAPDIVFLDIKMPGLSGLQVAQQLSDSLQIVFVTAYDEYAVHAFEHAAVDYLLKPIDPARLDKTIDRLKSQPAADSALGVSSLTSLIAQLESTTQTTSEWLQWLRVGYGDEIELIAADDVIFLKSDHKYTSVFTAHDEHVLRAPLTDLEQQLDPAKFWRIHRGIIVAVKEIRSAKRDLRGRYTLSLRSRSDTLRSSAAYKHLFAQM